MKFRQLLGLLPLITLAGCTISSQPAGGGYYVKTLRYFSWEPGGVASSLHFQRPDGGRVLVWKNFTGDIVVRNSTALFEGTTRPAGDYLLFAVKDGGPLFDVGNPILAFQAERERTDVRAFVEQHRILDFQGLTNGFDVRYSLRHGFNNPHLHISLTSEELAAVMERVMTEGKLQKDRTRSSYFQVDYEK